ncbi:MAG: LPXTG cell wall anchor domain-containing protein, partial [Geodermatophilaceae bacterium]|nr:LPXTG cell wall anchor domain-containing protein [Geodermatophilaceae bacterium]
RIEGVVVNPNAAYTVVANSFLTAGGDGFVAFTTGSTPVTGSHTGELSALAGFLLLSGACVVGRRRRRGVMLTD